MTLEPLNPGSTLTPAGRRKLSRVRLALPGKVIMISGHEKCLLEDLSQTGAGMTMAGTAPPVGADVVLMVQGVEAFGRVVWRRGPTFGVVFDEPVSREDVIRLRATHDHFQTLETEQNRRRAREFVQGRRFF